MGDALSARMRAVRSAERIVDIHVGQPRQRACERWIVARLARLEADVLEHEQLAGGETLSKRFALLADDSRGKRRRRIGQLTETLDDGSQREVGLAPAL